VGVCPFGNEIMFTQGSVKERRFAVSRSTYFDGPGITISEGRWTASGGGAPVVASGSATHAL